MVLKSNYFSHCGRFDPSMPPLLYLLGNQLRCCLPQDNEHGSSMLRPLFFCTAQRPCRAFCGLTAHPRRIAAHPVQFQPRRLSCRYRLSRPAGSFPAAPDGAPDDGKTQFMPALNPPTKKRLLISFSSILKEPRGIVFWTVKNPSSEERKHRE